jgi:hypothetical protein
MNNRTTEERLNECITLKKKLRNLGFNEGHSGMKELSQIMNKFVKDSAQYHGTIKFIEEPNIRLVVSLNLMKGTDCSIRVKKK